MVSTMVAQSQVWQDEMQAVGTLRAQRGSDLAAEVPGIIDQINFESGQTVAAGTVLARLRPNDDAAKLAELQAATDLAQANLARDTKQFHAQAVSQATIDADDSHLRAARAQVEQQKDLMAEKVIRAPFSGQLGLRQVDLGQYVPAGTPIVTLQALDPLFVDFYLPQQALAKIAPGEKARITVDAYPNRDFAATILAISPRLDQASRMVQIRAVLANADHKLLPGMFASVHLDAGAPHHYITLPQAALVFNPYGSTVYVADKGPPGKPLSVHTALVRTGPTRGDQVAVLSGLNEGDIVVTSGQLKLHPGSTIAVNNAIQPPDQASPHPVEE